MEKINDNINKEELINQLIEAKDKIARLNDEKKHLTENFENLKFLTETINEVFWLYDWQNRTLIYVSPGYKKIYGENPNELYKNPKKWISYIHPEDKERVVSSYYENVENGQYDEEFRVIRSDGKEHWVRDRAFVLKNELGDVSRVAGLTEFITDKKVAQLEANENKKRLELILDNMPIGVLIINSDFEFQYFNNEVLNRIGISRKSLLKLTAIDLIHPDYRQKLLELSDLKKKGMEVPDTHEIKAVRADGSWFWASIHLNDIKFKGQDCRIVSVSDITYIKGYEKSLDIYSNIQSSILEANRTPFIVVNKELSVVSFNSIAVKLFNEKFKKEIYEYLPFTSLFNKNEISKINKLFSKSEEVGKSHLRNFKIKRQSKEIWLSISIVAIRKNEKLIGFSINIEDVTLKIKEKELFDQKNSYFNSIINSKSEYDVFALDRNYKYIEFNNTHKNNIQNKYNFAISKNDTFFDSLDNEKDKASYKDNFDRALMGEEFAIIEEIKNRKNGSHWKFNYSPINLNGKISGIAVFGIDISKQQRKIEKLKDSESLLKKQNANKDRFISIIAHDLKAPMTGFIGLTKILRSEIEEVNPELHSIAESISDNAQSMFELLENLLVWTRSNTGQKIITPDNINLHLITQGTFSIFKNNSTLKNIKLINTIPEDAYAYADANSITTVIRNLVSNSLKFTKKGFIEVSAVEEINEVIVSVKDTGIGIPNEIKEKLLGVDSDYTSRGTNNETGTGIGLQLCREFVEKNGGKLKIKSEVGKGTTFSFNLPKSI